MRKYLGEGTRATPAVEDGLSRLRKQIGEIMIKRKNDAIEHDNKLIYAGGSGPCYALPTPLGLIYANPTEGFHDT